MFSWKLVDEALESNVLVTLVENKMFTQAVEI